MSCESFDFPLMCTPYEDILFCVIFLLSCLHDISLVSCGRLTFTIEMHEINAWPMTPSRCHMHPLVLVFVLVQYSRYGMCIATTLCMNLEIETYKVETLYLVPRLAWHAMFIGVVQGNSHPMYWQATCQIFLPRFKGRFTNGHFDWLLSRNW